VHRLVPGACGLGLGRDLVGAASELGFDILRLKTHAGHMPAAVALYPKLGYRETEPYHSVVGVEEVHTMEMRLRRLAA
jgi:hypothetical protein